MACKNYTKFKHQSPQSFTRTQSCPLIYVLLWLLLCHIKELNHFNSIGLLNLKYLSPNALQKKFANL